MLRFEPVIGQIGAIGTRRIGVVPERVPAAARRGALGLLFLAVCTFLIYLLCHFWALPFWLATLVGGELGVLAQFAVDDRWLFGHAQPDWTTFERYNTASLGFLAVFWVAANVLQQAGIEYLFSAIGGQAVAAAYGVLTGTERWNHFASTLQESVTRPISDWSTRQRLAPEPEDPPRWPRLVARLNALPRHLLPCLFLIAATTFAFRETLFFGYRYIGNSDRLNHYISFILYHTHYFEQGEFSAWAGYIFDGFDSLSLPMSFVTPLYPIPALLHTDDVVTVFGVIAPILFAFTLIEAYFVAYLLTHDRLASLAGACTYGFATYGLLKIEQSDQTYLSVLTAPAFFYLVHTTVKGNWVRRFVVLTLLIAVEFYFAFLQEFSYNVIFFFVYAAYLLLRRNAYPILAFALAMISGAVLSAPRLLVQYGTVATSGRGRSLPTIQDVVDARTLLRYFSRDIFGHSWREAVQVPPQFQINLHEGDLVHSSVFGALVFVLILLSFRWIFQFRGGSGVRRYDATVLVLYSVFVFAVMHNASTYLMIDRLYQNISFQHSRIGVSALLPIALLTALFLAEGRIRLRPGAFAIAVLVSALLIGVSALDFSAILDTLLRLSNHPPRLFITCDSCFPVFNAGPVLNWDLLRLGTLAALFVVLVAAASYFGATGRSVMKSVIAAVIVFQTIWSGADYLEGPQTRDYSFPYETNDFVIAKPNQFLAPTAVELDQVHTALDNDNYRSVTICPMSLTQQNCSTMIGMIWGIRLVDGYSSGVPDRLASLPWGDMSGIQANGHDVRFQSNQLPWTVLSFLNTRQGIQMNRQLYMNEDGLAAADLQLVSNPSPYIYPRAYFADATRSVNTRDAESAIRNELLACRPACDGGLSQRFPVDYVEGPVSGNFDSSGQLTWSGSGDRLTFDFPASPNQRFLVVNETWDKGWGAQIDGQQQAPVYPTNVLMRGVLVPSGATEVVLTYRSLLYWAWWYTPLLMALGGLFIFLMIRLERRGVFSRMRRARRRSEPEHPLPEASPTTAP
jgi:putative flippase GtrA